MKYFLITILLFCIMSFFSLVLFAKPQNIITYDDPGPRHTWIKTNTVYPFNDHDGLPYHIINIIRVDLIVAISGPQAFHDSSITPENNMFFYIEDENFGIDALSDVPGGITIEDNLVWAQAIDTIYRENPGGIVLINDYLP